MKWSLTYRVFSIFILGWLFIQLALLFVDAPYRYATRYFEQELLARSAADVAEAIVLGRQEGRSVPQLFAELRLINPDVEPYLLDERGQIVVALNPKTIGQQLDMRVVREALEPLVSPGLRCGPRPLHDDCVAYSVAKVNLNGARQFVYLAAEHGVAEQFSLARLRRTFLPGAAISFLLVALVGAAAARHLTTQVRRIRSLLAQFARGDYSERYVIRVRDDLALLGDSVNVLGETAEARGREARDALKRRNHLFAAIVHDLRRPVQAMKLMLERMQRDGDATIRIALEESLGTERLLLDALSEEESPAQGSAGMADAVNRALHEVRPFILSRGQQLTVSIAAPLPELPISTSALFRVCLNLLDNAVRYVPAGGAISVRVAEERGIVKLEVEDSGIGIPESELESIFEAAFRGRGGAEASPSGSGLGLAIAKSVAASAGGSFEVDSVVGRGSCFRLSVPTSRQVLIPVRPVQTSNAQLNANVSPNRSFERPGFLFELCSLLGFALVGFQSRNEPKQLLAVAPWLSLGIVLSLTLAAVQLQLCGGQSRLMTRRRTLWVFRALLFLSLGVVLHVLGSEHFLYTGGKERLYFVQFLGALWALGTFFRPLWTEAVPTTLAIGAPAIAYILGRVPTSVQAAFWVTVFGVFLLSHQFHSRRLLGLRFRTAFVLLVLYYNAIVYQGVLVGGRFKETMLGHQAFLSESMVREISRRLPNRVVAAGPAVALTPQAAQVINRIQSQSPRLTLRIIDLGTRSMPFATDGLTSPMLSKFLSVGKTKLALRVIDGRTYGVVPLEGRPDLLLFISADEAFVEQVLRKVGGWTLLLALSAAFVLVALLALATSTLALGSLRRRVEQIGQNLQLFWSGEFVDQPPTKGGDEIDDVRRDLVSVCERIETSLAELQRVEGQTLELITQTAAALREEVNATIQQLAEPLERATATRLSANNIAQEEILAEVFEYAVREKGSYSVETVSLRDTAEDLALDCATKKGNRIHYRADADRTIEADGSALRELLKQLMSEFESEVKLDIRDAGDPDLLTLTGAKPSRPLQRPRERIRQLCAERLAEVVGVEIVRTPDESALRMRSL